MTAGVENDRPCFARGGVVYRTTPGDDRIPFPLSTCLNGEPGTQGRTARSATIPTASAAGTV
jgi:hypothetical protein